MSRTNAILENPAVKSLKWKNKKMGKKEGSKEKIVLRETGWYYWDKTLNDGDGGEVKVELPISLTWLETSTSIMGYSEKRETGIYSNEILDLKTQKLVVKCGNDIIAEGLYSKIKEEVKGQGGKYCSAVYALVENKEGEKEIWRFLMAGSSNSAWISFFKAAKAKDHAIVCYDTLEKETKMGSEYEAPVFKYLPLKEEAVAEADQICEDIIKPFFDYYLSKPQEKLATADVIDDTDDNY